MEKLINFFKEEDGATAVEYGIMVALIAIAIIITVTAIGTQLNEVFQRVNSALSVMAS
jgi:pilus assembly protein Flp/PilA